MAAVIKFICRASAHQQLAKTRALSSPITYHADAWAFCPIGAAADHQWEAIEAVSLQDVRKRMTSDDRCRVIQRS